MELRPCSPDGTPTSHPRPALPAQGFPAAASQDRRTAIDLSAEAWFRIAASLGTVTLAAHNPIAALGWCGGMPRLRTAHLPVLPSTEGQHFAPNLAEFARLSVMERGAEVWVEVQDQRGEVFQRVVPHEPAAAEVLRQLADQCPLRTPVMRPWFPPNSAESRQRLAALQQRIPQLRTKTRAHSSDVQRLADDFPERLLFAAAHQGQRLRTTLFHPALVMSAVWHPEHASIPPDQPARFFGESVGLELGADARRSVWFWSGQCTCCQQTRWVIEIGGPGDILACAILAAHGDEEPRWRRFLREQLP